VGEGRRLTNYGKRKEPARKLRNSQTDAEKKLWLRLRDRRLGGFKFRRQVPIGPFFVDFCCADKNLIVEIDGGQHRTAKDDDANRSIYLNEQGFRVLRFWNYDVLKKINTICKQILVELKKPEY
jgi:very-short-patch-repair endonuclease